MLLLLAVALVATGVAKPKKKTAVEVWPDQTVMDAWFKDTTKVDVATLGSDIQDSIFKLPRLDVNDLPKDANAEPNKWYELG